MRNMPQLTPETKSISMTSAFRGYNHNDIIADGEMYDMQNLSGNGYPLLTLRPKRGITSYDAEGNTPVPLTGIHGRDQLVFVRGAKVYWNYMEVTGLTVSDDAGMCPKKIVSFGAYVCIWPDKVYFNTADLTDYGSMEWSWSESGSNISLSMCRGDGTNYDMTGITISQDPPANPGNGDLWMDQSGDNDVLRQYNVTTMDWVEVATTYVKISSTNIGAGLKEYDVIDIAGMDAASGVTARVAEQITALNGSKIVFFAGNDYIVVAGLLSQTQAALKNQTVTAGITLPALDFVCESNNRLWGCKYGLVDNVVVNEIYASKLGDFRNWSCFMGLSTDSYTASVGTDGP